MTATPPRHEEWDEERITAAAVAAARAWARAGGSDSTYTKELARLLARLRTLHTDRHGRADLRGSSWAYRSAVSAIYRRAGLDEDATERLTTVVRYHLSGEVRALLWGMADGDENRYRELCAYYHLNPHSINTRRLTSTRQADPALVLEDAAIQLRRALDALSSVDLSPIPEEARRTLRYRAREVRKRLDDILSALEA